MKCEAEDNLYLEGVVTSNPCRLDLIDRLATRSAQLDALLASVAGAGQSNFSELNEAHQANLLWLASDLSGEIRAIVQELDERRRACAYARY